MASTPAASITVAIPSRNRPEQLQAALASVRSQAGIALDLVVLNDASEQGLEALADLRRDPALRWIDNQLPLGWFNNRRRAFAQNRSPYFALLGDDNRLAPGHLARCVAALEAHPRAAFAAASCETRPLVALEDPWPADTAANAQMLAGANWLSQRLHGTAPPPHLSAVVFRSATLEDLGNPAGGGARHGADQQLLMELASRHNVLLLPQIGARIGEHNGRARRMEFEGLRGYEQAGDELEVMELIAALLRAKPPPMEQQRHALGARLHHAAQRQRQLLAGFLPMLLETEWEQRLQREQQLADLLPPHTAGVIVVRDDRRRLALPSLRQWPFLERDGHWNGNPQDDAQAITELERLREEGATAIVFLESAVWQLEHYAGFRQHLLRRYKLLWEQGDLVLFDLQGRFT